MIPREADLGAKQESSSNNGDDNSKITKASASTTASWSRLKDPRIVRVSRALGGKDRHSKVCTVRGLRDRRVRLSVPTAIQLYDLQERLGLNQPSKVVDWLLNAAKNEIDQLPPLQLPQGLTFTQMLNSDNKQGGNSGDGKETDDQSWTRSEEERHDHFNNFLSRQNHHVMTNYMSSFGRWDPSSNLTLSHTPISLGLTAAAHHQQHEDLHNFYHQSGMITHPYFTPQIAAGTNAAPSYHSSDSSLTATVRPIFNFNMTTTADVDEQNKRHVLHSS